MKDENSIATDDDKNITLKSFTRISLVVIAIQAISGFLIYFFVDDWEKRASFGDMFGAVSTLFSGLAFAGVICAVLLQRSELELQRNELKMTRAELKRSAEAQERSERALSTQAEMMLLAARLNAKNFFVEAQKNNIEMMQREGYSASDAGYQKERERFNTLFRELESLVSEVEQRSSPE